VDDCEDGFGCFPLDDEEGICLEAGDGELGDACEENSDCAEFSGCHSIFGQEDACHALCDRRRGFGDEHCSEGDICLDIFRVDVVGVCFDGCTPFVEEAENGCETDAQRTCVAIEDQGRGLCLPSGETPVGAECQLVENSIFGDCVGHAACDQASGECRDICRTFAGANDYESGCEEDKVCGLWGLEYGICTDGFQDGRPGAGEECDPEGPIWCSDDVFCARTSDTTAECLSVCRAYEGDSDCPDDFICQLGFFTSDRLGICTAN
jgi:hypothetical protein